MKGLTREQVEHVARLARLALSDAEKDLIAQQLGEVLLYMERLDEVATEGIEATSHVVDLVNVLREDVPEEPLGHRDAIRNAPESRDGMFIVPPVIDGEAS